MGRFRYALVALVVLGLVVPTTDGHTQTRDSESDCNGRATFTIQGADGDEADVAAYTLNATWCVSRVFETTSDDDTISQNDPATATFSAADADDAKNLKRKKGKKKGKRGRRNRRRGGGGDGGNTDPGQSKRSQRRLVSECISNFSVTGSPSGEADLIGATTRDVSSSSCSVRTVEAEGRFGHDYITGVPFFTRSLITQRVSRTTLENYPLGRVGYFKFTAQFTSSSTRGTCMSTGCQAPFEFCDVRIVIGNDDSCVRL